MESPFEHDTHGEGYEDEDGAMHGTFEHEAFDQDTVGEEGMDDSATHAMYDDQHFIEGTGEDEDEGEAIDEAATYVMPQDEHLIGATAEDDEEEVMDVGAMYATFKDEREATVEDGEDEEATYLGATHGYEEENLSDATLEDVLCAICGLISKLRQRAIIDGVPDMHDALQVELQQHLQILTLPEEEQIVNMAYVYEAVGALRSGCSDGSEGAMRIRTVQDRAWLRQCLDVAAMPASEQVVKEAEVYLALGDLRERLRAIARTQGADGLGAAAIADGYHKQQALRDALARAGSIVAGSTSGLALTVKDEPTWRPWGFSCPQRCLLSRGLVTNAFIALRDWQGTRGFLREDAKLDKATRRCAPGYDPSWANAGDLLSKSIMDLRMSGMPRGRFRLANEVLRSWGESRVEYMKQEALKAQMFDKKKAVK